MNSQSYWFTNKSQNVQILTFSIISVITENWPCGDDISTKKNSRKRLSIASLRCFQVVMRIRDDHRSLLVKGLHETWKRMLLPLAMVQVTFKYWTQIENNINKAKLSWNALEPVGFLWSYWIFNISWDLKSRVKILSNLCNINSDYFSRATSPLKMVLPPPSFKPGHR